MVGYPPEDEFWHTQRDQLRIPRIAPITEPVDVLRQRRPYDVPYVPTTSSAPDQPPEGGHRAPTPLWASRDAVPPVGPQAPR